MLKKLSTLMLMLSLTMPGLIAAAPAPSQKKPAQNVSPKRQPNIGGAQRLTEQAFKRITDAQQANEWDMEGHAQKAKDLLDQANNELKQAAEAANENKGKK